MAEKPIFFRVPTVLGCISLYCHQKQKINTSMPPLIETPPGRYRHYKGDLYEVIGTARHSETMEPMTIYRALYGEQRIWVRPAEMFNEEVTVDGLRQARFLMITD